MPDVHPSLTDLSHDRPIHLAGIAGSAMSGLALLLSERGFPVSGTDPRIEEVRALLAPAGVVLAAVQDGSAIPPDAQLVVASAALPDQHPELVAARARGLPIVRYATMLGSLFNEAEGLAVAGTHGKTTTTAMVVSILCAAGLDPGFVVGGFVPALGRSAAAGRPPHFVAEACEYARSFLELSPRRAVITNIEEDHLDCYADLAAIVEAFAAFAAKLPPEGLLVYAADCPSTARILSRVTARRLSCAVDGPADVVANVIGRTPLATIFRVTCRGEPRGEVRLPLVGDHNVANALAAIAVTLDLGVPFSVVARALEGFGGASRRFELVGEERGITVVDDYAHHPTELRACLAGARQRFPGRRLVLIFQPHQASRTRRLADGFVRALDTADRLVLCEVYRARDAAGDQTSAHLLLARLARPAVASYAASLDDAVAAALDVVAPGDVVLTVGAGDIHHVGPLLLERLRGR